MLYRFENCRLDIERRELRRGADLVAVEPQVFDLLHVLVRNRERVVSKDELIATVWNGRIVSDSALTSRIAIARQAIGDSGEDQRLIRTIARKGVRFVGLVRESAAAAESDGAHAQTKILVIDDHALIRDALRDLLAALRPGAKIFEAQNARQGLLRIEDDPAIEMILLDLNLPDRDGFEVLAELRERFPAVSIVVLSASDGREQVAKALDFGALGFIPKSASREVMAGAFNLVFAGGIYVPPEILPKRASRPGD